MPHTVMSGSDNIEDNDIEDGKENQNGASQNNNPSQQHGVGSQENNLTYSVIQGSGTSVSTPLQLKGSSSEIPQFFPTTIENSSDGNSLQTEQSEPQQIPSGDSAEVDDPSSHESAPDVDTSLDNLALHEDRISDESSKDCEEETLELPYRLQQQSTCSSDGTSTEKFHSDDQRDQQIDSPPKNIATGPQIRPGLLMQNSYCDDGEERPDNGEGGYQETGRPTPFQLPTRTGCQGDPGTQQARVHFVQPDDLVKDVIVSNTSAMDIIALHLDRSVHPRNKDGPVVQRWEHLADEFEVPNLTKKKCGNLSTTLSPSERMFQHLRMTNHSLAISDLKKKLEAVDRKDVVEELNKYSSLSSDDATVTDLWENHFSALSTVCIMLDDVDCPYDYKHLASELGISGSTLRTFKYGDSSESPSMVVLKILETKKPKLSTDEMVVALTGVGLKTIADELKSQPSGTIQTLLDDLEGSEAITALLDEKDSWFKFGLRFGIDRDILDSLRPDPIKSPSKAIINFIVSSDPNLRMKKFMESLNKIEHNKLKEKLKTLLHISWI